MSSRRADISIFGAENSLGPANTEVGLLSLSCTQSSHLPPKLLQRPRQPRPWLTHEYILDTGGDVNQLRLDFDFD